MSQLIRIIVIFSIAICNNFAIASDCLESVTLLNKGTPSPCTGFLFSPEAEQQVTSDSLDLEYYKTLSKRMEERYDLMLQQNEILDKRLKLYMDQSYQLSKEIQEKEDKSSLKTIGWFLLGVGVTGLAVYGAGQLNN